MQFKTFVFLLFCSMFGFGIGVTNGQVFQHVSEKEGAPKSGIMAVTQDKDGFIWYATANGLFRYDSRAFKRYGFDAQKQNSLSSDYLSSLISDSRGTLWVGSWGGLNRYDPTTDTFTRFRHDPKNPMSISSDTIYSMAEDRQHRLWIGTSNGLNCMEMVNGKVQFTRYLQGTPSIRVRGIAVGDDRELWLATHDGMVHMNQDKPVVYRSSDSRTGANNDFGTIYKDAYGNIWLGKTSGGLFRFDRASRSLQMIEDFKNADGDWPWVTAMQPDKNGKLWIATWTGLTLYDVKSRQTEWYVNHPANPLSLSDDTILSLFKDRQGGLWIGTYNLGIDYLNTLAPVFSRWPFYVDSYSKNRYLDGWGGITPNQKLWLLARDKSQIMLFDQRTQKRSTVNLGTNVPNGTNFFYLDDDDVMWYGGQWNLYGYHIHTGQLQRYRFIDSKDNPAGHGRIYRMIQDSQGRLVMCGSFGVIVFDKKSKSFTNLNLDDFIITLFEDSKGNIWCGTKNEALKISKGLERIERYEIAVPQKVGLDDVWRIAEDGSGRVWLVTLSGLMLFDSQSKKFIKQQVPLLDNLTDLRIDQKGYLWLSKELELLRYHPDLGTLQVYSSNDGLPRNGFLNFNSAYSDRNGIFYYITQKEMFSFDPEQIQTANRPDSIVITGLHLFNEMVRVGDETGILQREISHEKGLEFRHDQNIFTLDFALLSFARSERNRYRYMLEGFDKGWNTSTITSATYMNLPPGDYTFRVQAANGDGYWMESSRDLQIRVLKPWWKSWYAYFVYFILSATIVYLLIRFFWLRTTLQKENQLYQAKLDFFTNISHEVRTHLSLIVGPLEKAYGLLQEDTTVKNHMHHARNNSHKLMQLVNELLDFSKIQNKELSLQVAEYDLVKVIKNILSSFEHLAEERQIATQFIYAHPEIKVWFDMAQIQKVFYNLLSNAYKFTPEGGQVVVKVSELSGELLIEVINTGRGIAPKDLERVFDNFFQGHQRQDAQTGYGIGLALSKGIVDKHQGSLSVESRYEELDENGETSFALRLKKGNSHYTKEQLDNNQVRSIAVETVGPENGAQKKYTVLLVEDNEELRDFESAVFGEVFNILEAANGNEALELAYEHIPDLVLCDVMMPEQNGMQVCSQLKADMRTSHIPIILLTARSESSQEMQGLMAGADDYLVKPFDLNVLSLKINNLIKGREELRRYYTKALSLEKEDNLQEDSNGIFIGKLRDLVLENLTEPNFGVNEMAVQIGMSVSVLYRKLRVLTGMTVNEFMKTIKMKKALQLLESENIRVNEVALMIGYEDVRYFSREFKKVYGKNPSEFLRKDVSASQDGFQL
ncbi:hybrid sensor histidine kinase/response regulator transcription factor [Dyadobacter jejuensis]|nr:hybrid sensor histidine kinase/response regulator transcription factor [Dyadobacter jejuensis]